MGTGASQNPRDALALKKSRAIDRKLREERILLSTKIKLLLLGTSQSGKSTLAKQMRIIYQQGFSREDRLAYKHQIHSNVISLLTRLLRSIFNHKLKFKGGKDLEESASFFIRYAPLVENGDLDLTGELSAAIKTLWADQTVQSCFRSVQSREGPCAGKYFLDDVDRLSSELYEPTDQDILRSRTQTTGVIETHFQYKDYKFSLCDVGGQRTERRKWIHCFDNVTAVLFTVAMSHYDLTAEDTGENRLKESLRIFRWINEQEHLKKCSIILFLNQKDVLVEKIKYSPFSVHFPSYCGQDNYEEVSSYIRSKFENISSKGDKDTYSHFTNAIDTKDTEFVMQACMSTILNSHLQEAAMW